MSEFRKYAEKLNLSLDDDVIITADNVKDLGEYIATVALKRVMHCYGERGYKLYYGLLEDIVHTKAANQTINEGYEIASEAICYLCEFIGKPLGKIVARDKNGKEYSIKDMCFKTTFRFINKSESYVSKIADINHPYIMEMSVPFESESVKEKKPDIKQNIRKLTLTKKQKQVVNLVMKGMNPYQVSIKLKLTNQAIYARLKQVRYKYIKNFGVPYLNYTY